ncbi:hypothetical protein HZ326_27859 [Fusarium oxysporum f. sp. albedinis]|nr:hypothetical protein HZ326_27859 [Fusarium oxysporum f. sp. albedinis]
MSRSEAKRYISGLLITNSLSIRTEPLSHTLYHKSQLGLANRSRRLLLSSCNHIHGQYATVRIRYIVALEGYVKGSFFNDPLHITDYKQYQSS